MAADQRKKRLGAANAFGYGSRGLYREKKKHLSSTQFDLNWKLNSHASHKWDYNEKRAVAKEEEVGLAKSDLIPFKASVARHKDSLADVLTAPKYVFELDDLSDVLSFEAWESILTEKERSFLAHFLPRGVSPDHVVEDLLAGENFHFGNPFVKWSSSLCSGELHPEAVLHYEETCRADKRAYYSELQKYHDNMIRNLQKLKDRCATAKDPKAEIEKMMWRLRKQPSKNMTLAASEVRYRSQEHNTPDEKASSSDSQRPCKANGSELSRSKEAVKYKDWRPAGSSNMVKVASKSKKREKLQKASVNHGDGSKYMSYVKISKSQHELVRSMKQSGNSIQSKALNRVFGNITDFNVKPFVMFEEEEEKRIHEHWSNLARKDIPSAFSNWGKIQSERGQIMESLCLEIEEKLKHLMEEEETRHFDASEDESRHSDNSQQTNEDDAPSAVSTSDDDQDSEPPFVEEKASVHISALAVNQEGHPMDLNEEDDHISPKSNDVSSVKSESPVTVEASEVSPSIIPEFPGKRSALSVIVNNELPQPSATRDPWPAIAMFESSCAPSAMDFASCSELPLKHPQVGEDQSGMHLENSSKGLLPQQTDQLPFFGSYQNNERHDLLHTIVKHDNYHQEPKKTQLGFQPTTSLLMDSSQFPGHSREQLLPSFPFDPRHRVPNDFFMHPNIQENMFPDNSRFSIPRPPEQYASTNMRDCSSSRFSAPMHSRLGNPMELPNHNWFSVESRAQPSWSGPEVFPNPNPSLGSGSGGDQSLFSVLSQCSNLNPGAPAFGAVGTADKFMSTGNFAGDLGVGISRTNPLHQPPAPSPLDYLSGHDVATSTLKTSDMGWINLPHQSSALHDSTAKPYPKSWDQ